MKICSKCNKNKSLDSFNFDKKGKDKLRSVCIECTRRLARELYYNKAKEPLYLQNQAERKRKYKLENPLNIRQNYLKHMYNITLQEYNNILKSQEYKCAICSINHSERTQFHVDHDHSCCEGKRSCGDCIRGLLCPQCNVGIGQFGDNPALLAKAADYLNTNRSSYQKR